MKEVLTVIDTRVVQLVGAGTSPPDSVHRKTEMVGVTAAIPLTTRPTPLSVGELYEGREIERVVAQLHSSLAKDKEG